MTAAYLRATDELSLVADDRDATILREGAEVALLPGAGPAVATLIPLLARPRDRTDLRRALDHAHPPSGGALIDALVEHGALIAHPLVEDLATLHAATTAGGALADPAPPAADSAFLLREYHGDGPVGLPAPREPAGSLAGALTSRRSARGDCTATFGVEDLATLLAWGAGSRGVTALPHVAGGMAGHRTYPSGGALYMIETYVVALGITGLRSAAYRYQALPHRLVPVAAAPSPDALPHWLPECPLTSISALLVLAADWSRPSLTRYGGKAYRLALLEAGHIAQSVMLTCAAAGLDVLPVCGFDDGLVSIALGLEHPQETAVYLLAIGAGAA